jgi:hypothetical protein
MPARYIPEIPVKMILVDYRKSLVIEKYKPVLVIGILPMPISFKGIFKYGSILRFIFDDKLCL